MKGILILILIIVVFSIPISHAAPPITYNDELKNIQDRSLAGIVYTDSNSADYILGYDERQGIIIESDIHSAKTFKFKTTAFLNRLKLQSGLNIPVTHIDDAGKKSISYIDLVSDLQGFSYATFQFSSNCIGCYVSNFNQTYLNSMNGSWMNLSGLVNISSGSLLLTVSPEKYITYTLTNNNGKIISLNLSDSNGVSNSTHAFFNGSAGTNFSSVYFTNSDKSITYPHWVEDNITGKTHINVSEFDSSDMLINFGNTSRSSSSNGELTWSLYDHFEGASINTSKWTRISTGGTTTVSNSIAELYTGSTAYEGYLGVTMYPNTFTSIFRHRVTSEPSVGSSVGFGDSPGAYLAWVSWTTWYWEVWNPPNGDIAARTIDYSTYQTSKIVRNGSSPVKYYTNDVLDASISAYTPTGTMGGKFWVTSRTSVFPHLYLDWIVIGNASSIFTLSTDGTIQTASSNFVIKPEGQSDSENKTTSDNNILINLSAMTNVQNFQIVTNYTGYLNATLTLNILGNVLIIDESICEPLKYCNNVSITPLLNETNLTLTIPITDNTFKTSLTQDFANITTSGTIINSSANQWNITINVTNVIIGQTYNYNNSINFTVPVVLTYTLSGTINNTLGDNQSKVHVTLSNGNTSITDVNGYYELTNLTDGDYTISTQAHGYDNYTSGTLSIASDTTYNFTLEEKFVNEANMIAYVLLLIFFVAGTAVLKSNLFISLGGLFYSMWYYSTQIDHTQAYAYLLTAAFLAMWIAFLESSYRRIPSLSAIKLKYLR